MWLCGLRLRRGSGRQHTDASHTENGAKALASEGYLSTDGAAKGADATNADDAKALLAVLEHMPYPVSVIFQDTDDILLQNKPSIEVWGDLRGRESLLASLFQLADDDVIADAYAELSRSGKWRGLLRIRTASTPAMPSLLPKGPEAYSNFSGPAVLGSPMALSPQLPLPLQLSAAVPTNQLGSGQPPSTVPVDQLEGVCSESSIPNPVDATLYESSSTVLATFASVAAAKAGAIEYSTQSTSDSQACSLATQDLAKDLASPTPLHQQQQVNTADGCSPPDMRRTTGKGVAAQTQATSAANDDRVTSLSSPLISRGELRKPQLSVQGFQQAMERGARLLLPKNAVLPYERSASNAELPAVDAAGSGKHAQHAETSPWLVDRVASSNASMTRGSMPPGGGDSSCVRPFNMPPGCSNVAGAAEPATEGGAASAHCDPAHSMQTVPLSRRRWLGSMPGTALHSPLSTERPHLPRNSPAAVSAALPLSIGRSQRCEEHQQALLKALTTSAWGTLIRGSQDRRPPRRTSTTQGLRLAGASTSYADVNGASNGANAVSCHGGGGGGRGEDVADGVSSSWQPQGFPSQPGRSRALAWQPEAEYRRDDVTPEAGGPAAAAAADNATATDAVSALASANASAGGQGRDDGARRTLLGFSYRNRNHQSLSNLTSMAATATAAATAAASAATANSNHLDGCGGLLHPGRSSNQRSLLHQSSAPPVRGTFHGNLLLLPSRAAGQGAHNDSLGRHLSDVANGCCAPHSNSPQDPCLHADCSPDSRTGSCSACYPACPLDTTATTSTGMADAGNTGHMQLYTRQASTVSGADGGILLDSAAATVQGSALQQQAPARLQQGQGAGGPYQRQLTVGSPIYSSRAASRRSTQSVSSTGTNAMGRILSIALASVGSKGAAATAAPQQSSRPSSCRACSTGPADLPPFPAAVDPGHCTTTITSQSIPAQPADQSSFRLALEPLPEPAVLPSLSASCPLSAAKENDSTLVPVGNECKVRKFAEQLISEPANRPRLATKNQPWSLGVLAAGARDSCGGCGAEQGLDDPPDGARQSLKHRNELDARPCGPMGLQPEEVQQHQQEQQLARGPQADGQERNELDNVHLALRGLSTMGLGEGDVASSNFGGSGAGVVAESGLGLMFNSTASRQRSSTAGIDTVPENRAPSTVGSDYLLLQTITKWAAGTTHGSSSAARQQAPNVAARNAPSRLPPLQPRPPMPAPSCSGLANGAASSSAAVPEAKESPSPEAGAPASFPLQKSLSRKLVRLVRSLSRPTTTVSTAAGTGGDGSGGDADPSASTMPNGGPASPGEAPTGCINSTGSPTTLDGNKSTSVVTGDAGCRLGRVTSDGGGRQDSQTSLVSRQQPFSSQLPSGVMYGGGQQCSSNRMPASGKRLSAAGLASGLSLAAMLAATGTRLGTSSAMATATVTAVEPVVAEAVSSKLLGGITGASAGVPASGGASQEVAKRSLAYPYPHRGNQWCQWHEVSLTSFMHPQLNRKVILVVQNDVSARIWAERQLARVVEAEHTLLENIFPQHVIQHIATTAAAAATAAGPLTPSNSVERTTTGLLEPFARLSQQPATAASSASPPPSLPLPSWSCPRGEVAMMDPTAMAVDASTRGAGVGSGGVGGPLPAIRGDAFLHLATSHRAITVLFCDIQGFTPMCNEVPPSTVMAFLNDLFTRVDRLLDPFGVYKVETIGDCYVAAGGLMKVDEETGAVTVRSDDVDPQHAYRTVQFAKALLSAATAVRLPTTGQPVRLRVGIHSGPAMSGVVGTRMPRFCLFGDTINTASRMESTGVPGAIHVSQATRDLVPGEAWEATGGVEVKGKGNMSTFVLRPPVSEGW